MIHILKYISMMSIIVQLGLKVSGARKGEEI